MADVSDAPQVRQTRRRVHSINFDPAVDDWMETIVARLARLGYPRAGRSVIVREALVDLQERLADRTDGQILMFFVERDTKRLLDAAQAAGEPGRQ